MHEVTFYFTTISAKVLAPETVLKQRKHAEKTAAEKAAAAAASKKERKQKRQVIFKRAEQYVKEYRQLERSEI
ncbi:hypothetical protein GGI08_007060, partial [Coemansia sp. S2]